MRTKKGFCLTGTGLALGLASLFGAFYGGPAVLKKLVVEVSGGDELGVTRGFG